MRFRPRFTVGVLLASRLALAQPGPGADAGEAARAEATALVEDAARAFKSGAYDRALAGFEAAYAKFPSPRLLFNLGQTHERLGHPVEATEAFERFLATAGGALPEARARAERSIEQLRNGVARLEIVANVSGAEVSVDGRPCGLTPLPRPILVAPGAHVVAVAKPGAEPFSQTMQALGGTLVRVEAALRPAAAPSPPPPLVLPAPPPVAPGSSPLVAPAPAPPAARPAWAATLGWGLVAAAPVLGATGLYLGKRAQDEARTIADACRTGCEGRSLVDHDRARERLGSAQWILLGGGAAALAGGAAVLLFTAPEAAAEGGARLSVRPAPGGATAVLGGRF